MMTKAQEKMYQAWITAGKIDAAACGEKLAAIVKNKIQRREEGIYYDKPGIDSIWTPLLLEPMLSALDYGYETIGQCNFMWTIDLYIGRKCARIIPLLIEQAKRLHDRGHITKAKKIEGGGPDHYYWLESYSAGRRISMRWDTQSRSYYIDLDCSYPSLANWKLYVAEYKWREARGKAEQSWDKEPGFVLEYKVKTTGGLTAPEYLIDEEKVENAWLRLPQIRRWMDLINTVCCTLDIDLYKPPFAPEKTDGTQTEQAESDGGKPSLHDAGVAGPSDTHAGS